ncbi:MAG: murein DD-endopeptidase MepM/ murein hydrolase activator NlpD [Cyclobacteriaceae bacterium]
MAPKKTLSNWLTNRYLLIIRNEENFAEKKTISFNYARVILILAVAFSITLGIAIYLVTVTLEEWLDPRFTQMRTNRQLVDLTVSIDSLEYEMNLKDQYINNIKLIVSGDPTALSVLDSLSEQSLVPAELKIREISNPIDSQFRAEFESEGLGLLTYRGSSSDEFRELYLFSPMEGIITDGFNPKENHFGVDIVAKEGEPVVCVTDGVVIFSSWTLDSGNVIGVQHRGNLISVYKHNSELLKNVGSFVSGGDIIAIIGNTGELTSGPHLHFELWHNGNSVNPQEYVAF